jgi:AraC family transcriptional regulator
MDRCRIDMDKIGHPEASALLSKQVTEARYFFLNLAPRRSQPLVLVMGGREQCNPDYAVTRPRFPFYGIELVVKGRGTVSLDGKLHPLAAGSVFAYAPATRCELKADPAHPMTKYFLSLSGRDVAARLKRCGVPAGHLRVLTAPAEITSVLEDLVREGRSTGGLKPDICAALSELLLLKIEATALRTSPAVEPAQEAFLRCKALIDAQAEKLGTLEEIATAACVEASSVCRWFRRYQGTSPYQYLLRRKMTLAAEHLIEHGGLVKEVAQRVGFDDPYHFSRAFKAVHGVAPRTLLRYRIAG